MTVTPLPVVAEPDVSEARWVPQRAGILNVWRYCDEVFEFHRGRLLLRGPNGSGKSKALELLLPFLFDAQLKANRLSTFGTGERSMHWNMMGEGATGTTRVGYVWLEFRLGTDRYFTCGARLQASSHTTTVHPDYFTTDQRVGIPGGLALSVGRVPLSRAALGEAIGVNGVVADNATEYRERLRTRLFPELSAQRYDALIMALLQLRMPKLSQRLDPSVLSSLLSRALPPLGDSEIVDLAEGFERLDAQRERLHKLDEEVTATEILARRQRGYAQRVLRSAAAELISANTTMGHRSEDATKSAAEYAATDATFTEVETRIRTGEGELSTVEAKRIAAEHSDEYKQGSTLDRLRRETENASSRALRRREEADGELTKAEQAQRDHQGAERALNGARTRAETLEAETRQVGARAAMTGSLDEIAAAPDLHRARALLRAALHARRDAIKAVQQTLDGHRRAIEKREDVEKRLGEAREDAEDLRDKRAAALEAHVEARRAHLSKVREWAVSCRVLAFEDTEALLCVAESESESADYIHAAAAGVRNEIGEARNAVRGQISAASSERKCILAERNQLLDEQDILPSAPSWRTADRSQMRGAPLWALLDFADGITEPVRGRIEAAMEAAGLLDAWVGPRGQIEGHDVFADPEAVAPVTGSSLADVLTVVAHPDVESAAVRRLLAAVAYSESRPLGIVAVSADGGWRSGNLTGSAVKAQPDHIGVATRKRARERRIHELNGLLAACDEQLTVLATELEVVVARATTLDAELAGRPGHAELNAAQRSVDHAEAACAASDKALRGLVATLSQQEGTVKQALMILTRVAAENGLPAELERLNEVGSAVDNFGVHASSWLDAVHDRTSAQNAEATAAKIARETQARALRAGEAAENEQGEYRRVSAEYEEAQATIGLKYQEVLDRLAGIRTRLKELREQLSSDHNQLTTLGRKLGELSERRERDYAAHQSAVEARDSQAQRFRRIAGDVFPADSELPDLEAFNQVLNGSTGVTAALEAARKIAAAWPTLPHEPKHLGSALNRLNEAVHECRTALSSRADLELAAQDDAQVLTATIDGLRVSTSELLRRLRREAEEASGEITTQERRLFDRTLTGDTRRHLAARIRQANDLVKGMNARLERVRTASNVSVKLVWQVSADLPAGTKAARDLLLKNPISLSDAEHQALHQFLRDRIDQAKADDTATSWEQQLAQVFDYTAWHQFVVKIDRGNGEGYQLLTKKLHGALSGGEKAIALHLPLFAAVAAHYQAAPNAPRVILLDEVFVGVDTTNRGQIFALLSALDLDLILTSDHEWCTYPELDGIAIHQILTDEEDEAVTTARFVWDGIERIDSEVGGG